MIPATPENIDRLKNWTKRQFHEFLQKEERRFDEARTRALAQPRPSVEHQVAAERIDLLVRENRDDTKALALLAAYRAAPGHRLSALEKARVAGLGYRQRDSQLRSWGFVIDTVRTREGTYSVLVNP